MEYERTGFASAADGTRLYFGLRGRGPAIMLHDGIGCDGWAWESLQPVLSRAYTVLHWHYRGHGRSGAPRDRSRIDVPSLAADAVAVLDAAGVEDAVHVGHSMGVQVALETYRHAARRVRALVLVCGTHGRVTRTFHGSDTLEQVLPAVLDWVRRHRGLARALWGRMPPRLGFKLARWTGEIDAFAVAENDFVRYLEHLSSMDPDLFLAMLERAGEHTAEDLLGAIAVPTLVVAGERDTFTPPSLSLEMAERIPGAEMFVMRGGSHAAPVEQPVSLQLRLEKFLLERVGLAARPSDART